MSLVTRARSFGIDRSWGGLWLAVIACAASCSDSSKPDAGTADASRATAVATGPDLRRDDRLAHLVGGCSKSEPFLADTSDPIPALVSKLASGNVDPLRNAREELAAIGEPAMPALERLFHESYGEQFPAQRVQNVVEVVGWMKPTDRAHDLLALAVRHPQETIRKSAARALVKLGRPSDYDGLMELLPLSSSDSQGDLLLALIACDRPRLEREFVAKLTDPVSQPFVDFLAPHLCTTHDPEVLAGMRAALPQVAGRARLYVQAAVAAQPDESVLSELRTMLFTKGNPIHRQLVAQAMVKVGLAHEMMPLLSQTDPDVALRKATVDALSSAPFGVETRDTLRAALTDPSPEVRDVALATLTANGDAPAIDVALQMLLGSRAELESGLRALRDVLAKDAALSERVLDTLIAIQRGEAGSGMADERTVIRAIGQVPSERAAKYVLELFDARPDVEANRAPIQGLAPHRWYVQAAGNTGAAGAPYLRRRWLAETDPARRMDLVSAICFFKNDDVRAFLLEAIEDPRLTPPERLHVADRCARFGPMATMAPVLKRAALRMDDPILRPAFNCLLWDFYGVSK